MRNILTENLGYIEFRVRMSNKNEVWMTSHILLSKVKMLEF